MIIVLLHAFEMELLRFTKSAILVGLEFREYLQSFRWEANMSNPFLTDNGRTPLSSAEREQFERYVAEIFWRLGMDLKTEACMKTPQRWLQALIDMTDGYDGDPKVRNDFSPRMRQVRRE